jgi:DNA polymerase sigma
MNYLDRQIAQASRQFDSQLETYQRKEEELVGLKQELDKKQSLFTKTIKDKSRPLRLLTLAPHTHTNDSVFKGTRLYDQLHQEIEFFYEDHEEFIANNTAMINEIISEIENIAKEAFSEIKLKPYGSFAMGLHMPWSDVDLLVTLPRDSNSDSVDILGRLEALLLVILPDSQRIDLGH